MTSSHARRQTAPLVAKDDRSSRDDQLVDLARREGLPDGVSAADADDTHGDRARTTDSAP